jgi:actin related protein 2/3 complex subunit 1A/1B
MSDVKRLAPCITCHSWNKAGDRVALCPNNNEILIYKKSGNNYTLEHTLSEHDQVVTSIDWGHKTGRLVSCSQDRNAYVWTFENNKWKPVLVILRINRAATHVKWSPQENKFAVASGAKLVSICYFEQDNDWWVSKHIKKHKSTVLKLDWHPNNVLIATGSSDYRTRVFSAFIKDEDKTFPATPFGNSAPFGDLLCEIDSAGGWVQSVRWSPSGNLIGFVAQDSSFNVTNISSGQPVTQTIKLSQLPFRDLEFFNENTVVAVGHDCTPVLFQNSGGNWTKVKQLDTGSSAPSSSADDKGSAFKMFKNKVDKGTTDSGTIATQLTTKHQNCITTIAKCGSGYSTTGMDGNLIIWAAPK